MKMINGTVPLIMTNRGKKLWPERRQGRMEPGVVGGTGAHNIKIIAPGDDITIYKNGTSSIDDNNTWVEYTNGVVSNKYNGNLLPGTEEFENSSYWEKNGY